MTIVLVHGAWCGAWSWKAVARKLRALGHDVYAPTLTGLAERSHVDPGSVTLSSQIADIAGLLEYEDLSNVLLVAHSFGGMVATGAADRAIERIGGMVYLDAFLPENGQALWDIAGTEMSALQRGLAEAHDGGKSVPVLPQLQNAIGIDGKALHFTPQPAGTLSEPFVSVRDPITWPRRHYILCTRRPGFGAFADRVRGQEGWELSEIDARHDVPWTHPDEVAARIDGIGAAWGLKD
jgi:pimeloyl-ACP methyl ester carboxylesterase